MAARHPAAGAEEMNDAEPAGPPKTLAIDIGGTGLKASILDESGKMVTKRVRVATPNPCPPQILVNALAKLVAPLPTHDRISVGFPGVVRDGRIVTAPHFADKAWIDYPLEQAISSSLGKPARLLNDAEVQGLGIIAGQGLEVVLTLGTGVGSAVFINGALTPHLELAHHPIRKNETYNEYLGNAARRPSRSSTRSCTTIFCIWAAETPPILSRLCPPMFVSRPTMPASRAVSAFGTMTSGSLSAAVARRARCTDPLQSPAR
jgi:hypothetical protein